MTRKQAFVALYGRTPLSNLPEGCEYRGLQPWGEICGIWGPSPRWGKQMQAQSLSLAVVQQEVHKASDQMEKIVSTIIIGAFDCNGCKGVRLRAHVHR